MRPSPIDMFASVSNHCESPGRSAGLRGRGLFLFGMVLCSGLAVASPSRCAQPGARGAAAGAPTAADKDAARVLVAEADSRFANGDHAGAAALYGEAYRRVHVPTVGLALAKAQLALGQLLEAHATAAEVAALPVQPGEPKVFERARADALELAERLKQRLPSVVVETFPTGAQARIQLDGGPAVPARGAPIPLNPGQHHVVAMASGYFDVDQQFELREGEPRRLRLTLLPMREGAVAEQSAPVAPVEEAPVAGSARKGSPAVHAQAADAPNDSAKVRGYVALGVAGLGIAVGSTTGILAFTTKPDCPGDVCPEKLESDIASSKRFGNIANVSFAVAAVAGVYGLWELLANAPSAGSARAARTSLPVALTPTGSGVLCEWKAAF